MTTKQTRSEAWLESSTGEPITLARLIESYRAKGHDRSTAELMARNDLAARGVYLTEADDEFDIHG